MVVLGGGGVSYERGTPVRTGLLNLPKQPFDVGPELAAHRIHASIPLSTHTVDFDPFIKSQLVSTRSTLGPYVVQMWSRYPQNPTQHEPSSPPSGTMLEIERRPLAVQQAYLCISWVGRLFAR